MKLFGLLALALVAFLSVMNSANAQVISAHVLDIMRGSGGGGVPITLLIKEKDGSWKAIKTMTTDSMGRVESFGEDVKPSVNTYKLHFDMSNYGGSSQAHFFPEINVVFDVKDASTDYHIPVVFSPYGYSTYRGN